MGDIYFKRPSRNYRNKKGDSDDEKANEGEQNNIALADQLQPAKEPTTIKKSRSVLSFEDDLEAGKPDLPYFFLDEGVEFKVKKSSQSRKSTKHSKEKKKPTDDKRASPSLSLIPELTLKKIDVITDTKGEKTLFERKFLEGVIPDAAAIHFARKQRERAKSLLVAGGSENFEKPGSRMIREEEDDFMEDDGMGESARDHPDELVDDDIIGRHTFRKLTNAIPEKNSSAAASRPRAFHVQPGLVPSNKPGIITRLPQGCRAAELDAYRADFLAAEHASDRDSDEEAEWERQQLQKAMLVQNSAAMEAIQPCSSNTNEHSKFTGDRSAYDRIMESLTRNQEALEEARIDLLRGQGVIKKSREKLPEFAEKASYFQELSSYISDLIDCFNEKVFILLQTLFPSLVIISSL
ncbi:unnamed protein product [Protopolystoma xenopodis]|uniref:GCF C-terminal domain-containing protein n=1 Tax=Protopolystoma xenopodis TaxID=117903 RepID=A0A3S5FD13_9PLAT|nr:unnamed protein product [Protopolystoma xenopodis]